MTDLLTHVLVAGITLSLLGRWRGWPASRYVPLGMGGATLPDITKMNYVVPRQQVADLLGVPFSWLPFHRLGGAVAVAVGLALLFERGTRRTVLAVLLGGVASHFLLDALIERAHGVTPPYLYPLSWYRPPAGNLYLSSDVWPAAVAAGVAAVVLAARRYAGDEAG